MSERENPRDMNQVLRDQGIRPRSDWSDAELEAELEHPTNELATNANSKRMKAAWAGKTPAERKKWVRNIANGHKKVNHTKGRKNG